MGSHQLSRPRRLIVALVAAASLWPAVARGGRSFIPIPEIITDPNEGNTIGLLGVLLFLDDKDQIQYMVAPDLRYNKTTGIFPAFRFFGYPSPERRYSVVVAKSTTRDEDYELEYTDRSFWEGRVFWAHQVALTYDSRDSTDIPTRGALGILYGELTDKHIGSASSFVKFGADWRDFIPLRKGNPVLALHALASYTSGDKDTPFWELSSLGGRRALRGFGSHRFIDFNRSLATAELRTRVYQRRLFGVNLEIELAPFTEAGQVFRHVTDSPVDDLHFVYGLGFRGVVRPQIVGFVDIGRGSEGNAIFTGIDYPF